MPAVSSSPGAPGPSGAGSTESSPYPTLPLIIANRQLAKGGRPQSQALEASVAVATAIASEQGLVDAQDLTAVCA